MPVNEPLLSNFAEGGLLVGVGCALVLGERERAVRAGVDVQGDWIRWLFAGVLQLWPPGDDGARADIDGPGIDWGRGRHRRAPRGRRAGPEEVPPPRRAGQIRRAGRRLVGGHRRDQERRTEHVPVSYTPLT